MKRSLYRRLTAPSVSRRLIVGLLMLALVIATDHPQQLSATANGDGVLRRIHIPTLMYHHVGIPPENADKYRLDLTVKTDAFRHQLMWLKNNGYQSITPDDLVAALTTGKKLANRSVLLTFDDGYDDAYTYAFPILKEFGFVGTFFVVTSWIDEKREGYLTWAQAKEMARAGMSIESHSRAHEDMRNRDHDWLMYHMVGTLDTIQTNIGVRPTIFCYPSGYYDQRVIDEEKAAGIVAAFTTQDGTFATTDNMLRLPRIRLRNSTSLAEFMRLLVWER